MKHKKTGKALLALVLTAIMLVSVLPAAAWADEIRYSTGKGWADLATSRKASKAAVEGMENMLKSIVVDNGVFRTMTTVDSMVVGLTKAIYEGIEDRIILPASLRANAQGNIYAHADKVTADELAEATELYLRNTIGAEISDYMKRHQSSWLDSKGNIKPEKYMDAFATAACRAVSSDKAVKGIEALMMEAAALQTMQRVAEAKRDLYYDIIDWEDGESILAQYGFAPITRGVWTPLAFLEPTVKFSQNSILGKILNEGGTGTTDTGTSTGGTGSGSNSDTGNSGSGSGTSSDSGSGTGSGSDSGSSGTGTGTSNTTAARRTVRMAGIDGEVVTKSDAETDSGNGSDSNPGSDSNSNPGSDSSDGDGTGSGTETGTGTGNGGGTDNGSGTSGSSDDTGGENTILQIPQVASAPAASMAAAPTLVFEAPAPVIEAPTPVVEVTAPEVLVPVVEAPIPAETGELSIDSDAE